MAIQCPLPSVAREIQLAPEGADPPEVHVTPLLVEYIVAVEPSAIAIHVPFLSVARELQPAAEGDAPP
jgi:hypothetical protein